MKILIWRVNGNLLWVQHLFSNGQHLGFFLKLQLLVMIYYMSWLTTHIKSVIYSMLSKINNSKLYQTWDIKMKIGETLINYQPQFYLHFKIYGIFGRRILDWTICFMILNFVALTLLCITSKVELNHSSLPYSWS